jgi:hypothetical protein
MHARARAQATCYAVTDRAQRLLLEEELLNKLRELGVPR